MRQPRAFFEAWLKNGVRSLYDVHARAYLILGLIAGSALSTHGNDDPWVVRSSVWGIVLLALSATIFAAFSKRKP